MDVASAPTPASGAPAQGGAPMSIHERIKSSFSSAPAADTDEGSESAPPAGDVAPQMRSKAASPADEGSESAPPADKQVPEATQAEDQADAAADVQSDDAQSEERQFSNLSELLEAGGFDLDKGLDLELPVKIDGKEGTARLRDLVKSYQLDGHINQRLETFNNDRKAFEAEKSKFTTERADKLLKMDAGVKTLERALYGEFSQVDWQKLAAEDPAAYNATYVQFQQREAYLRDVAQQISAEQAQHQAQSKAQFDAHLTEQRKLVEAKFPEWADATIRTKDKAEMASFLKSEGAPEGTFERITDAWQASVVRKALLWERLQKTKPGVLNKVKAAPKLLKPGSTQSRAASDAVATSKDRDRLKQSGKVRDAVPSIRRALFG